MTTAARHPERVFAGLAAVATLTTAGLGYIAAQDMTADIISQTAISAMFTAVAANLALGRRRYRQHQDGSRPATNTEMLDDFFFRLEIAGNMLRGGRAKPAHTETAPPQPPSDSSDAIVDAHGRVIRRGQFTKSTANDIQQIR
jgi:hypothetical protein